MQINDLVKAKSKQIRVLYITTLVLFLPLFVAIYFLYLEDSKKKVQELAQPEPIEQISVNLNNKVQTDAYAAIVVSLNTNYVIYEKNPDKQLPLASLTKLVTAKVADDQINSNNVSVDKMTDFAEYGDARLIENASWNKKELIQYTLVTSSNDGAHSLAQNIKSPENFIQNMNSLVASIGLVNTRFYNETGLDDDSRGVIASKGTAADVSKILSYVIKTDLPLYEKTQHNNISIDTPEGVQAATNTNEIADKIPGLLVSKTGYTDLAGGNLAVVADMGLNEPTAFVVLKSSTKESRFDDVLKLQEAYFKQVRERMR
jgi:D-alanyl-D-alanine carboxypeptidase